MAPCLYHLDQQCPREEDVLPASDPKDESDWSCSGQWYLLPGVWETAMTPARAIHTPLREEREAEAAPLTAPQDHVK